jgi:hypothetical protein
MVSPNWPSEDDPDYTPEFAKRSNKLDFVSQPDSDIKELREDLEELVDDE